MERGLHAGELDCLLRRVLGDVTPFLGTASRAEILTRTPGIRWLGVFARDELPDIASEERPFALVLNTDTHDKPGTHWLAIYGPPNGPLELFDSFGLAPSRYGLGLFKHSRLALQSFTSALCGNYCIYFLYLRFHNQSFDRIINYLKSMHTPDNWVRNYVDSLKRKFHTLSPCLRIGQCSKLKCSLC